MRTPEVFIKGLGVFLPDTVAVEDAVEQGLYPEFEVELHELAGAAVAGETPAPEMALRAAQEAYKRAGHRPEDTDLLLYADSWHQGPDGWQPQYYLQRHLVGDDVLAVEVRQGCNGMFGALELGAAYLRGQPAGADGERAATALLVASDNFGTPMMDRWRMGPGYVAGDAASAVILTTEPSFAQLLSVGSVAVSAAEQMHRGAEPLFPPGPTVGRALDFQARNAEYKRAALADGVGTGALVRVHGKTLELVQRTLDEAGIALDDVTRVAYMNYSREIVEQRCMAALGLPMEKSTWDFGRTVGHLGASDQVISLDHLVNTGDLQPGDHLLMLGVGPGVTLSSAVVRILNPAPWRS
ncbi:ketoacyl-ACP synthase III family protein [Streptomyces antarcticus]|uniref:ketoacyl-ACP synthase III family protein n=1 Tax=Streptomyces antarcticus TaxID=2996458 RepID=UPI00226DB298|nr:MULTISPECIES: ketoacyl-ACP synthase III family protein [unclassified Streptomyces]MCY0941368.1 ketoacyl-ACP synthase III family protein [Streptomyces sp. H34-AA3]MCZ4086072.1 ketoacyl-ACP synthase III family protein [Streptomyces sp. H34-S5]